MAKFSFLKISDLERGDDRDPIWVLNIGAPDGRGRRPKVIIQVPKMGMSNQMDTVIVASTFIPICITDQVKRASIMESSDFRRAVNKGLISLVTEESAEAAMMERSNITEKRRVEEEEMNVDADANAQILAASGEADARNSESSGERTAGVNPAVMQIMLDAEGEDARHRKPEDEVRSSLKRLENKTETDYEYILEEARKLGYKVLARKVEATLARMEEARNAREEDDEDEEDDERE